mmetsp:Transcript_16426/g.45808  ORF Transcript_16426/g.45808 Transcript_16426/m.45808 type:complete len:601 (-) Transcript_16426:186-1988(-)
MNNNSSSSASDNDKMNDNDGHASDDGMRNVMNDNGDPSNKAVNSAAADQQPSPSTTVAPTAPETTATDDTPTPPPTTAEKQATKDPANAKCGITGANVIKSVGKMGKASVRTVSSAGRKSIKTVEQAGKASLKTVEQAGKASLKTVEHAGKASIKTASKIGHVAKTTVLNPVFFSKNKDMRWEELQSIEKRRRKLLTLVEEPFWKILMHWDGTVLSHLKSDSLLWITIGIYVVIRIGARLGLPDFVATVGNTNNATVSGFLSFFLVFYVNQSNSRFFGLYGHSMACKGRIFDIATLARACLPFDRAHRLVRYMNAAHAAGYVGLSSIYPARSYFDRVAAEFQLLTLDEKRRMDQINLDAGGSAHRELVLWAIMEIHKAKQDGLLDPELANQMREHVLRFRAAFGQLINAKDLPIPFFYVHFISLLTVLYLPFFAVSTGIKAGTGDEAYWVADVVSGLLVILQAIFVIGLRILAQQLSDPYGDDLIDLSVMFFVQFTWTQSNRVLQSQSPPELEVNLDTETLLNRHRISVGGAWDDGVTSGVGPDKAPEVSTHDSTTSTAAAASSRSDIPVTIDEDAPLNEAAINDTDNSSRDSSNGGVCA